jgi:hypothetical protein
MIARYHVVPARNGWAVKRSAKHRATRLFADRSAAREWAEARAIEVVLHNARGTIETIVRRAA